MKMKFTLLAAAVAMTGIGASAQTYSKLCDSCEPSFYEDLTYILTPSNTTKVADATFTETSEKVPGIQPTGCSSIFKKYVNLNGDAPSLNTVWGELGPDEKTIGVYADGSKAYVRFRYNASNQRREASNWRQINAVKKEKPVAYDAAYVQLVIGPKPADATSDVITPTMELCSGKTHAAGKEMVFTFPAITLTDETQEIVLDMTGVSGDYFNEDGTLGTEKVSYVDVYLNGVSSGQFVALQQFGFAKTLPVPTVGFNTETTRKAGFNRFTNDVSVGTIYIQAEDFDGYKAGEEPTFSPICTSIDADKDGYGYPTMPKHQSHWSKGDMSFVRLNKGANMNGGFGTYNARAGEDGLSSANDGWALIGMSKMDGEWGTNYGGEYLDETSNKISMEQAMDGFGSWFEYTFNMEKDGFVDISIGACSHSGTWISQVLAGGLPKNSAVLGEGYDNGAYVTKYKKSREEGGYEVEGLDDDFLKLYGFCYVVSFDGVEQRTNWDIRPKPNKMTGVITPEKWVNPQAWELNQETDENNQPVNSKFLFIHPAFGWQGNGGLWFPHFKSDLIESYYYSDNDHFGQLDGHEGDAGIGYVTPFKEACDAISPDYFEQTFKGRPDYIDIPCSAGKHTIRVKSMGGSTVFDEIRIHAKKERSVSGIESIAAKRVAEEFAGEPEYFDLQGRRVAAPTKGIFIVKRGSNVTKEVIR